MVSSPSSQIQHKSDSCDFVFSSKKRKTIDPRSNSTKMPSKRRGRNSKNNKIEATVAESSESVSEENSDDASDQSSDDEYEILVTREQLETNYLYAALGNLGGSWYCRICDTKFTTGVDRSFQSQFKAHAKSKAHNEHKSKLLKKMGKRNSIKIKSKSKRVLDKKNKNESDSDDSNHGRGFGNDSEISESHHDNNDSDYSLDKDETNRHHRSSNHGHSSHHRNSSSSHHHRHSGHSSHSNHSNHHRSDSKNNNNSNNSRKTSSTRRTRQHGSSKTRKYINKKRKGNSKNGGSRKRKNRENENENESESNNDSGNKSDKNKDEDGEYENETESGSESGSGSGSGSGRSREDDSGNESESESESEETDSGDNDDDNNNRRRRRNSKTRGGKRINKSKMKKENVKSGRTRRGNKSSKKEKNDDNDNDDIDDISNNNNNNNNNKKKNKSKSKNKSGSNDGQREKRVRTKTKKKRFLLSKINTSQSNKSNKSNKSIQWNENERENDNELTSSNSRPKRHAQVPRRAQFFERSISNSNCQSTNTNLPTNTTNTSNITNNNNRGMLNFSSNNNERFEQSLTRNERNDGSRMIGRKQTSMTPPGALLHGHIQGHSMETLRNAANVNQISPHYPMLHQSSNFSFSNNYQSSHFRTKGNSGNSGNNNINNSNSNSNNNNNNNNNSNGNHLASTMPIHARLNLIESLASSNNNSKSSNNKGNKKTKTKGKSKQSKTVKNSNEESGNSNSNNNSKNKNKTKHNSRESTPKNRMKAMSPKSKSTKVQQANTMQVYSQQVEEQSSYQTVNQFGAGCGSGSAPFEYGFDHTNNNNSNKNKSNNDSLNENDVCGESMEKLKSKCPHCSIWNKIENVMAQNETKLLTNRCGKCGQNFWVQLYADGKQTVTALRPQNGNLNCQSIPSRHSTNHQNNGEFNYNINAMMNQIGQNSQNSGNDNHESKQMNHINSSRPVIPSIIDASGSNPLTRHASAPSTSLATNHNHNHNHNLNNNDNNHSSGSSMNMNNICRLSNMENFSNMHFAPQQPQQAQQQSRVPPPAPTLAPQRSPMHDSNNNNNNNEMMVNSNENNGPPRRPHNIPLFAASKPSQRNNMIKSYQQQQDEQQIQVAKIARQSCPMTESMIESLRPVSPSQTPFMSKTAPASHQSSNEKKNSLSHRHGNKSKNCEMIQSARSVQSMQFVQSIESMESLKSMDCFECDEYNEEQMQEPLLTAMQRIKPKRRKIEIENNNDDAAVVNRKRKQRSLSPLQVIGESPPMKKAKLMKEESKSSRNGKTRRALSLMDMNIEMNFEENNVEPIEAQVISSKDYCSGNITRGYQSRISHVEMVDACPRTKSSDFINGTNHCWQAQPMMLPGGIRMAEIGYSFECSWCGKQVYYVEEALQDSLVVTAKLIDEKNNEECEWSEMTDKRSSDENSKGNNNNENRNGLWDDISEIEEKIEIENVSKQAKIVALKLEEQWKRKNSYPIYSLNAPSYARTPLTLDELREKDRVLAADSHGKFLNAWVQKINRKTNKAYIHYIQWASRWDQWIAISPSNIRPLPLKPFNDESINFIPSTLNEYIDDESQSDTESEKENENENNNENDIDIDISVNTGGKEKKLKIKQEKGNKEKNKNRSKSNESLMNDVKWTRDKRNFVFDADILTITDQTQVMSKFGLPIHNQSNLILHPPSFHSFSIKCNGDNIDASRLSYNTSELTLKQLVHGVKRCFPCLNLTKDEISLLYKTCNCMISELFSTLQILKSPQRVDIYVAKLKEKNN